MTRTIPARLIGLTATLAILAVLAGLPAMLLAIGANPIPDHVPTTEQVWSALTSRDDGTLTLRILAVVAWLGWAFLTATLTLEVLSRLRRMPTPHLPALALPQSAARGLVGAAVLLFAAGPALPTPSAAATQLVAATAPARTTPAAPARAPLAASHHAAMATRSSAEDSNRASARTHTVTTGESLWSIADTELGDGARWHEIADLNPRTHGPQWRIFAGTTLTLPTRDSAPDAPRRGGATYTVRAGDTLSEIAEDRLGDPDRYPQIFQASRHTHQPDGRHLRDPDLILPGWHLTIPGTKGTKARTAPEPAAPQLRAVPGRTAPDAAVTGTKPADPGPATNPPTTNTPATSTRSPAADTTSTAQPHGASPMPSGSAAPADDAGAAPWLLAGLAGAPVLAGSLWMLLRRRRAAQTRHRRPGRTIATPPPVVAPVEKTLASVGSATEEIVELVDQALRALASHHAATGQPMPAVGALEISRRHLTLHLSSAADLPTPWTSQDNRTRWSLPVDTDPADLGKMVPDQPAPYPLLVTIGTSDTGHVWLYNCEDLAITVTGDHTYGADFARYLAAEIACNPWSAGVTVDCVGVATEVAPINPDRIRAHTTGPDPAAQILTDAVNTIDRAGDHHDDVVTARAHQAGADTWHARLLLLDATTEPTPALTQLITLLARHPGATGTSVVLAGGTDQPDGTVLQVTSAGRVRLPQAGLDLVAVGLTSDEARGCAALIAAGEDLNDQPIPTNDNAGQEWRAYTDAAGALRPEHTIPRDTPARGHPRRYHVPAARARQGLHRPRRHHHAGPRRPRPAGPCSRPSAGTGSRPGPRRRRHGLVRRRLPPTSTDPARAGQGPHPGHPAGPTQAVHDGSAGLPVDPTPRGNPRRARRGHECQRRQGPCLRQCHPGMARHEPAHRRPSPTRRPPRPRSPIPRSWRVPGSGPPRGRGPLPPPTRARTIPRRRRPARSGPRPRPRPRTPVLPAACRRLELAL